MTDDDRCSPTTAGLHQQRRARAARAAGPSARRGCPAVAAGRRPGRAARARRARLGPARRTAAALAPTLPAMAGGSDHAPSPRRPRPRRSPRSPPACPPGEHGVVGYRIARRRRGAQRAALDQAPSGDAAAPASRPTSSRPNAPFLGPPPAGRHPRRVPRTGLHPGPPRRRPASRLPGDVHARHRGGRDLLRARRAVRLRLLRGHRQGRPRVRPRRVLRRRAAPPPTASSPTSSRRCPPARCSSSPPTTARSTSATTSSTPHRDVLGHVRLPVGRGPVPLAARPPRARRRPCSRRPGRATADQAWVVTARAR